MKAKNENRTLKCIVKYYNKKMVEETCNGKAIENQKQKKHIKLL